MSVYLSLPGPVSETAPVLKRSYPHLVGLYLFQLSHLTLTAMFKYETYLFSST